MVTCQFVADMATSSPSVLLDLNTHPLWVGPGFSFDPPAIDKGWVSTPMQHGSRPTKDVAGNRMLRIPVQLVAASESAGLTLIDSLCDQIAVNGIVKMMFGSTPGFFKYYGNPEYSFALRNMFVKNSTVLLELQCEPWMYGVREEVTNSPFTVNNDPANATNPCRFDVTGILGSFETPLLIQATSTGAANGFMDKWTHFGVRRRGTPSNYVNVIQAEDMTNGVNAADVVDATYSNGNRVDVTFANTTNDLRVSDTFPGNGTATPDARGEYQVYARVAKVTAGDTIKLQLGYGSSSATAIKNDQVTMPAGAAGPYYVNLGKMPLPAGADPVSIGGVGVDSKAVMPFVGLWAQRTAGSGALRIDYLYFVPADDSTIIVDWPATDTTYVLDGTTPEGGSCYAAPTTLDEVTTTAGFPQITGGGGFPHVTPGRTNRIHMLRQVDPAGTVDAIANTTTLRVYYWPRWREPFRT